MKSSTAMIALACVCLAMMAPMATAFVPPLGAAAAVVPVASLSSVVSVSTTAFSSAALVLADEMELAELPPPYVPALFGVALLIGVGVLTGSLGNVMDEEASLGMQSGARAKKVRLFRFEKVSYGTLWCRPKVCLPYLIVDVFISNLVQEIERSRSSYFKRK